MDNFLKGLARLDGFELPIYGIKRPAAKYIKKGRKQKDMKIEEEITEFPSVCEADFYNCTRRRSRSVEPEEEPSSSSSDEEYQMPVEVTDPKALAVISRQELSARFERGKECKVTRLLDRPIQLLNAGNLQKILTKNLELTAQKDPLIREKLLLENVKDKDNMSDKNDDQSQQQNNQLSPLITAESYLWIYEGVKEFLKGVFVEIEHITREIDIIWPKRRTQAPTKDIATDLKRLRAYKLADPHLKLADLLEMFAYKEEKVLDIPGIPDAIVKAALKLVGANHYGPTRRFAQIINCALLDNEEEEHDNIDADNDTENDDIISILSSVSTEEIYRIQEAIRRALELKLKK